VQIFKPTLSLERAVDPSSALLLASIDFKAEEKTLETLYSLDFLVLAVEITDGLLAQLLPEEISTRSSQKRCSYAKLSSLSEHRTRQRYFPLVWSFRLAIG